MKTHKLLICGAFVLIMFAFGNVFAQTCFDPNYGYYDCSPNYYYPDQGQALMEGAFLGLIIGGFNGNENHWRDGGHRHWNRGDHGDHDHRNGGHYH
jgi:hypothetical protein